MKRILLYLTFLAMGQIACEPQEQPTVCYKCITVVVTDYCAVEGCIDEVDMQETDLQCNWTAEDAVMYEEKSSFMIEEKCFVKVQVCRCYQWKQ